MNYAAMPGKLHRSNDDQKKKKKKRRRRRKKKYILPYVCIVYPNHLLQQRLERDLVQNIPSVIGRAYRAEAILFKGEPNQRFRNESLAP